MEGKSTKDFNIGSKHTDLSGTKIWKLIANGEILKFWLATKTQE